MLALNAQANISRCVVKYKDSKFKSEEALEYLGGTCTYLKKGVVSWSSDDANIKASNRLNKAKAQRLRLNSITTTSMSKVVSLPRYACAFNGIKQSSLEKLDVEVAEHLRKAVGLDNILSKAVIYGPKHEGGLGVTPPSALYSIEPVCSALRMFNSSSSITQQVALAAWNDNINDEYWKLVKSIASDANWSLQSTDDTYKFVNQFGVETSPRTDILNQVRANSIISLKGTLDKNSSWHRASTSKILEQFQAQSISSTITLRSPAKI